MLERLTITNFRCLRSVDVPLKPLTVLIGPNDTGKSTFLSAIQLLVQIRGSDGEDCWRRDPAYKVSIDGWIKEPATVQPVQVGIPNLSPQLRQRILDVLCPCSLFQPPSDGIRMVSEGYADSGQPPPIEPDGKQVAALLDYFLRRDLNRFARFVDAAKELVPGFENIQISTPTSAQRSIDLVIDNGLVIPADRASVGLRLMLFFLALAYHPDPPKLILLEEPENGVHPKRLADIMRLLREITQGKHGKHAAQIILTTHSPYLLDHIKLEEDDEDMVLVFRRNEDGSRTAEPVDAGRLKDFLGEFMLGEIWFNEGEAGLVGPSA